MPIKQNYFDAETSSHNIGVTIYQNGDYAKATPLFRRAIEYLIKHRSAEHINGEVTKYCLFFLIIE